MKLKSLRSSGDILNLTSVFRVLIKNSRDLIPIEPGGITLEIGIDNIFLGNYFYVLALQGVFPNNI
jgi:hypothetical protein